MVHNGFTQNEYDSCVCHKNLMDDSIVYLLLYVDDMLITTKSMTQITLLNKKLYEEFEIKDFGATK